MKPQFPISTFKFQTLFFTFYFSLFTFYFSFSQPITFRHTYGGASHDHGRSVKQTFDGGYIVAGSTSSFGYGNSDVYLLKLDSLGIKQWSNVYGGTNVDWGMSVVQTPDSGYVIAGYTNSFGNGGYDVYLLKVDSLGNLLWSKTYGGTDWDLSYSLQKTTDGGLIIAGETYSFGNGNNDVYLIKTDSLGDTLWTKTFGGTQNDFAKSVKQTFDGGYILAGTTESFGNGMTDIYIVKTDANGDTMWTRSFGGDSADVAYCVHESTDTNYVIAAATSSIGAGKMDFYILELNNAGDSIWSDVFGGPDDDEWYTITQDGNENFLIAGYSVSTIGQGKEEIFLVQRNKFLSYVTQHTYGGSENERVYDISANNDEFIVVGSTSSFGCGYSDVYLIKSYFTDTTNPSVDTLCDSLTIVSYYDFNINNSISAFPNPSSDEITIIFERTNNKPSKLRLYNMFGIEVMRIDNIYSTSIILKRGALPDGIYHFIIETDKIISNSIIFIPN